MSYDIDLTCPCCKRPLTMPGSFVDGGTYCIGGTNDCHLNVTYNYSKFYARLFPATDEYPNGSIRWLYGRRGAETVEVLEAAVEKLGTERDDDYWEATAGNAGAALARLLSFAEQNPDGVWEGD